MSNYKNQVETRTTLGQKIREYLFRKKLHLKVRLDWRFSILNPRYRKHCKLKKICDSLTDKHKWIEEIGHHYSIEDYENDEVATTITIEDHCYDCNGDKQDFEKEFNSLIQKNGLSDCANKRFEYRRFNHDWLEYNYE